MAEPTTPKHQRATSIQLLDSNLGRTPSQPTSHYYSSTKIIDAKANLKTILATRVSYNDPDIVDVLVKPNEVSDEFVQIAMKYIHTIQLSWGSVSRSATRPPASKARSMHPWYVGPGVHITYTHASTSISC